MEDDVFEGVYIEEEEYISVGTISGIEKKKSYKGLTGGWTKWGGARQSVATNQYGDVAPTEEWFCQSCCLSQPPELSPLGFEYPEGERLRVCAICFAEGCKKLLRRIELDR